MFNDHSSYLGTWVGNIVALSAVVSSLAGLLPVAAALIAIVWYAIQIRESETYRNWRRNRRRTRLLKLRERMHFLQAQMEQEEGDTTPE